MTPEELAAAQRKSLLSAEKRSAANIFAEFGRLKNWIQSFLEKNFEPSKKSSILDNLSKRVDEIAPKLSKAVEKAQTEVIDDASKMLIKIPDLETSIFEMDNQATQKLIGRTGNGSTLEKSFQRIKEPLLEIAAQELTAGFFRGDSHTEIAKRLSGAADLAQNHALTISRTEQNEAYRAASRDFYKQAGLKEYVWMSVLNSNTCVICWHLHGQKFPTKKKIFSHPNCRCVMVPVTKGMKPIVTGAEKFAKLSVGFQKQILGAKKFELYQSGDYELSDFVGTRKGEKGAINHYPRGLAEITPGDKSKPKPKPAPKPEPKPELPTISESAQAAQKMREISDKLSNRLHAITLEQNEIMTKFGTGGASPAEGAALMKRFEQITQERLSIEKTRDKQILDVLRVDNPTAINADFKSKFKAANKQRILDAIDDFNSLVDEKFLNGQRIVITKGGASREYYLAGAIHIGENTSAKTVIHEISHGLEQMGDGILQQALDFYEYRTEGEEIVKLRKFNPGYRANETCKVDNFWSPYIGKTPYVSPYTGKPFATEIISMGVERFAADPLKFAESDPEYFDFIYTILRGKRWSKLK